jgi:hypothetical protein
MCQGIVKQLSSYGLGTLRRSIEVINRGRAGIEIRAQIGVAARAEETGPLASTPSKVCRTDAPVLPGPGRARVGVAAISTCLVFTKPLNSRSPLSFTGYFDALSTFVCSCVAICVSSIACLSRRSSIAAAACTGGVDEQAAAGTLALVICCCKAASWRRISSMSRCDCSSAPGCASLHHSVSGSAAQDSPAQRCTQPRIVVCQRNSAFRIIWAKSRELSLYLRYQRTQSTMISRSKCRPLNKSDALILDHYHRHSNRRRVCTRTPEGGDAINEQITDDARATNSLVPRDVLPPPN